MTRIPGVEPHEAGLLTRIIYWFARRSIGKEAGKAELPEPLKITAHHPRLLKAYAQMELGQRAANTVDTVLKTLASVRVATLIGCPF